ncbi:chorismate mutase [Bulleidia sp. zg-1006]|uniref:chorismate mutase n=1 Tax=Bulleidia sp. zg-1006 TaxID=2806552 RepID=UPI0019397A2D|nr:chorismate mutase [Bulleidia sp. zg-1006]QRG86664.1 chorismate mutase [Bulleidia sp. zg-1006]
MNELEQIRSAIDTIDQEMVSLFEQRMNAVQQVIAYKKAHHFPILDTNREKEVLQKNSAYLKDSTLIPYYERWLKETMRIAKQYQKDLF